MEIIIPYLHYIGIMVLMGSLITEHLVINKSITKEQIKSLAIIDLIYITSAILVLSTGLLRWFVYGKGYDFYMSTPLFHIKITLFFIIGILAIFPSRKISKWKRNTKQGIDAGITTKSVKSTLMIIRIELLLIAIMPLLAVLIARGV